MDRHIELFLDFRSEATQQGFCFCSNPVTGKGNPLFNFYFNQGDIYTSAIPEEVYRLVMFARTHATINKADYYEQRDAYGLLSRVVPTSDLAGKEFLIWDQCRYNKDDPNWISLADWLELNGLPIPEFVPEPVA